MQEEDGRFLRKTNSGDVSFSDNCLSVSGKPIVRKNGNRFLPLDPEELSQPFGRLKSDDALRERLEKVARLLDEGRQFEAILIASMGHWATSTKENGGGTEATKANFNPFEPRDNRARWTRDGFQSGSTASVTDVQYRGYLHDVVVDDLLKGLESTGSKVLKNVKVFGIDAILAIPDGVSLPIGQKIPYFIEVKTGADPKFTVNQNQVYPLICVGGHATSFDPRISQLGLIPGVPFPPLDILLAYTAGPGLPIRMENYCELFGFRRTPHAP